MKPKRTKHQHQYGYNFGTRFTSLKRVLIVDASGIMTVPAIPLWYAASEMLAIPLRYAAFKLRAIGSTSVHSCHWQQSDVSGPYGHSDTHLKIGTLACKQKV